MQGFPRILLCFEGFVAQARRKAKMQCGFSAAQVEGGVFSWRREVE
jgi:hypothetical protein